MYSVELYSRVRRACHVDGMSAREAARQFGLDRKTVSKILKHSLPPGYRVARVRRFVPSWIRLSGSSIRSFWTIRAFMKKQRHTAKRIFERLRDEHGFAGGLTIVSDYVREKKRRNLEVFVPLSHAPGHAQVDFGEALGVIGGVACKLHYMAISLPHSDAFFMKAYPAETTEAFCDGHNAAFAFFRRRAPVDALRQHHDRGGEDLRRVQGKSRREVPSSSAARGRRRASRLYRAGSSPDRRGQVFLAPLSMAPYRPFGTSSVISGIVRRGLERADITHAPSYGAHLLRHSAATSMLRAGATLEAIGAVLRHRSVDSTAYYAKVDVRTLSLIAQPWPGSM